MSINLAREELRRADESLTAARVCLDNGLNADSISRSYYAVFHAAKAALYHEKGIAPKKHNTVRGQFGQYIVKPGLVERYWGSKIGELSDLRGDADYDVAERFSESEASEALDDAEAFVKRMRPLVEVIV